MRTGRQSSSYGIDVRPTSMYSLFFSSVRIDVSLLFLRPPERQIWVFSRASSEAIHHFARGGTEDETGGRRGCRSGRHPFTGDNGKRRESSAFSECDRESLSQRHLGQLLLFFFRREGDEIHRRRTIIIFGSKRRGRREKEKSFDIRRRNEEITEGTRFPKSAIQPRKTRRERKSNYGLHRAARPVLHCRTPKNRGLRPPSSLRR